MNVQSIKCVACPGSCSEWVRYCGVEGYSSLMQWMVVGVVRAGRGWSI